jgi:SAM-dependent methyltransferase
VTGQSEYDRWEERYANPEYVFGREPNAFLKGCGPYLQKGQKALAVADGEGRNGVWLAQQGLDVLSIDFSPAAIGKARKLAADRKVSLKFEIASLEQWKWPTAEFDVVAAIFIQFAGPSLRTRIFDGIRNCLKPGGLLLLEGYRPKQLAYGTGGPSEVENMYTREILLSAFGDWEIFTLHEYDTVVSEGARHSGMSALIDLVARKPSTEKLTTPGP